MLATNCPMPGRIEAAQASPVSAWMSVSREQNDHPLVPPTGRSIQVPRLATYSVSSGMLLPVSGASLAGCGLMGACFIDGGSLNSAVATLYRQRCSPNSAQPCELTLMEPCRPAAAAAGLAARDSIGGHFGRSAAAGWSERRCAVHPA